MSTPEATEPQPNHSPEARHRSRGERIKAAREKKAKEKQKRKGQDADLVQAQATETMLGALRWVSDHRVRVGAAVLALCLAVGGVVAWSLWKDASRAAASTDLEDATRAALGTVSVEGQVAAAETDKELFGTTPEKWTAASKRFRKVVGNAPSAETAIWGRLGWAQAQLNLNKHQAATRAFTKAKDEADKGSFERAMALEGLGRAEEAQQKLKRAAHWYGELSKEPSPGVKDLGDFHLARVTAALGDTDKAKNLLKNLHRRLNNQERKAPKLDHFNERVAEALRTLDPEAMERPAGGMSQAELQRLLQQLQQGGNLPAALQ